MPDFTISKTFLSKSKSLKFKFSLFVVLAIFGIITFPPFAKVATAFAKPDEIERWLALAEAEKLATAELRRRIRLHRATFRIAAEANSAPAFRLMRELRTAARVTQQQRGVWRHWPPSAWRLAFDELQPLMAFVDALHAAIVKNAVVPPRDPGAN